MVAIPTQAPADMDQEPFLKGEEGRDFIGNIFGGMEVAQVQTEQEILV